MNHGSDLPFVFNQVSVYPGVTTRQKVLAEDILGSWAAFATDGDVGMGRAARANTTVAGWAQAIGRVGGGNGDMMGPTGFDVRVLGGPYDGMAGMKRRMRKEKGRWRVRIYSGGVCFGTRRGYRGRWGSRSSCLST